MPESKARTAQVQTSGGWETKSVSQLMPGDKFRLCKPDGTLVTCSRGNSEFTAGNKVTSLSPKTPELRQRVRERFAGFFTVAPVACA